MSEIRYLIDENTTRVIGDQLRRRQPDVVVLLLVTIWHRLVVHLTRTSCSGLSAKGIA